MKNEEISTFAFNTGKEIERIIDQEMGGLKVRNQNLEAKVLQYYHLLRERDNNELIDRTLASEVEGKITYKYNPQIDRKISTDFANYFSITIQREGKL